MTKQDVITRMTNKGAIEIKEATAPFPKDYNGNEMHDIHYRRSLGADSDSNPATLRLIKKGVDDFVYENGVPSWMQDAPATTPPRALYKTEEELKTIFSTAFPTLTVINLDVRRKGNMDIATVDASNGTNILPEQKYGITSNGDGTFNYEKIA